MEATKHNFLKSIPFIPYLLYNLSTCLLHAPPTTAMPPTCISLLVVSVCGFVVGCLFRYSAPIPPTPTLSSYFRWRRWLRLPGWFGVAAFPLAQQRFDVLLPRAALVALRPILCACLSSADARMPPYCSAFSPATGGRGDGVTVGATFRSNTTPYGAFPDRRYSRVLPHRLYCMGSSPVCACVQHTPAQHIADYGGLLHGCNLLFLPSLHHGILVFAAVTAATFFWTACMLAAAVLLPICAFVDSCSGAAFPFVWYTLCLPVYLSTILFSTCLYIGLLFGTVVFGGMWHC